MRRPKTVLDLRRLQCLHLVPPWPNAPSSSRPGRHAPKRWLQGVRGSTNQLDFYTPQRFGLTYHDSDGAEKPLVVIHRAPLGSHERFVAYLTEHFAGAFPVWLAPEQVRIIPIVDDLLDYANEACEVLRNAGLRVDVDASDGRLPAKVRAAVIRKIPLIVVVGRREAAQRTVSVRYRSGQETPMSLDEFVEHAKELVRSKSLEGAGHLRHHTDAAAARDA